jgi:predicted Zn-dependent protease
METGERPIHHTMTGPGRLRPNQARLLCAAATVLLLAGCQDVSRVADPPGERQPAYDEIVSIARTDRVRVHAQPRYIRITVTNSPLRNLSTDARRQKALDMARTAFARHSTRSTVRVVDVAFAIDGIRFLVLPYSDARDSFRFDRDELDSTPPAYTESWMPASTPPLDLYFVAIGDVPSGMLEALASYFENRFGIPIMKLAPLSFDRVTFDAARSQNVADEMIAAVRFRYPRLARDPRARVIGITPHDMYMKANDWAFTFSLRADGERFAVVSYARMDPANFGDRADEELLMSRLRKMVAKNIGIMFYALPQSRDPRSVLYGSIGGLEELDDMSEYFAPQ